MKLQRIKIENYKSIKNLQQNFDGNVFIVKGDNEEGKTTFCRSFLKLITKIDKPEVPVTVGQAFGSIEGTFVDKDGNKFTVICDFTNDKESLRMISSQGLSTNKIGEIRNFFDYSYVDVEEFISWSSTAEGRRKQRDLVLDLLPEKQRAEFREEEEREKQLYESRRIANKSVETSKAVYESSIISEQEKLLIENHEQVKANLEKARLKYDKALASTGEASGKKETLRLKKETLESAAQAFQNLEKEVQATADAISSDIAEIELQLRKKRDLLEKHIKDSATKIQEELDRLNRMDVEIKSLEQDFNGEENEEDIEVLRAELKAEESMFNAGDAAKTRKITMTENLKAYEQVFAVADKLNVQLEETRKRKEEIFLESNLPIDGLSIDEDGILLNKLPFTREQLSTSQIVTTVFKIVAALNTKTPIFYLGRAESLGKKKLDDIVALANEMNYQVFLDKVEAGGLTIELFEDVDHNTKIQPGLLNM